jgi:hypothetical protein
MVEDANALRKDVQELLKATDSVVGEKADSVSHPLQLSPLEERDASVDLMSKKKHLKYLLGRIPISGSFESAKIASEIAALVSEIKAVQSVH